MTEIKTTAGDYTRYRITASVTYGDIEMFQSEIGGKSYQEITRIEFEYTEDEQ